nr:MAG TPA_asm: hypothetical protein [Caudoviricetes sp.]
MQPLLEAISIADCQCLYCSKKRSPISSALSWKVLKSASNFVATAVPINPSQSLKLINS